MVSSKNAVVPNQIFIGCAWKTVRPKYLRVIEKMNKRYPLSFIVIGKEQSHTADDLLSLIKEKLRSSNYAIFDVTGGNANVSLEFGYAEASGIEAALYMSAHGRQGNRASGAIISDLAGKKRKQYTTEPTLRRLVDEFCRNHSYSVRFDKAIRKRFRRASRGTKKRVRVLGLRAIHALDDKSKVRREALISDLEALPGEYRRSEIDQVLAALHKSGLIHISPGRYSDVTM